MTNGNPGPAFYDDPEVFATYMTHRERPDTPNDTLEGRAFRELLASVAGLRILDLGCGNATFGRELLQAGAASYTGVDASKRMLAAARTTLDGTMGNLVHTTIEEWISPPSLYDLVVSRLALHYVDDVEGVFRQIFHALVPGGRVIFSVEHPVITSCDRGWPTGTRRQDWIVDDYFQTGERVTQWLGSRVVKYHHTIEEYVGALQRAGFTVEGLREGLSRRENFTDEAEFERRLRIPLFLLIAGRKPNPP